MSQHNEDQSRNDGAQNNKAYDNKDVERYLQANLEIESNRHHIADNEEQLAELEHSESVELFQKQVSLLQKHLVDDPKFFQQMFINDGTAAITWEFQQ
ncbi:MAG: hypothetical protein KAT12_01090, partial [Gammaproteobacteria bacterium]|nr:hypothetical protein [Gammaproteobacteria bacterium]